MSLPARPSPRSGGLPSMPRGSDRSERGGGSNNAPPSRSVRPQRSAAQLPSSRARPSRDDYDDMPPPPRSSSRARSTARSDERSQRTYSRERGSGRDRDRDYDRPPLPSSSQRASGSSTASSNTSSGGSSFLDRMRVRSNDTTPRTSIDDDSKYRNREPAARDRRRRRSEEEEDMYDDERDYDDRGRNRRQSVAAQAAAEGDGSWLWKSVTSAASSLTVNINKAWTSKVTGEDGEETPAGEESRLTRAMKAYHLAQAQRPSDLPDWLFSSAERNPGRERGAQRDDDRERGRRSEEYYDEEPAPRSRGLRDIYDSAAKEVSRPSASANRSTTTASSSSAAVGDGGQSKATNRLKAIRDAKRAAAGMRDEPPAQQAVSEDRGYAREREAPSPAPAPRARVGLPTGPGRARRI